MLIRENYDVNADPRLRGTSDEHKTRWTGWLMRASEGWRKADRRPAINQPVQTWQFGVGRIVEVKDDGMVAVVRGSNQHEQTTGHYTEFLPL